MTMTNSDTDDNPLPHAQLSAERLTSEFGAYFTQDAIVRTVAGSIADLAGVPIEDLPELAERVARQRLFTALELHPESVLSLRYESAPNTWAVITPTAGTVPYGLAEVGPATEHHTPTEVEGP
ncbi:hypothetical protein CJ179_33765 [Rhodococcus sp. ACS1]|jgi:hypothetical protein|nr:hypothetical protein CJ179_33765 [Rhodococcus sp. ACS1]